MASDSRLTRAFRQCRALVFVFGVALNLTLIDEAVKEWAFRCLKGTHGITVVPQLFNLYYVENRGCAWGMFQGNALLLAAFALLAFAFLVWKRQAVFGVGKLAFACESLLYAGILGNLVDRLCRGFVVDMFDFHWGVHHFPVFNVADAYITIAAGLLIVASLVQSYRRPRGTKAK